MYFGLLDQVDREQVKPGDCAHHADNFLIFHLILLPKNHSDFLTGYNIRTIRDCVLCDSPLTSISIHLQCHSVVEAKPSRASWSYCSVTLNCEALSLTDDLLLVGEMVRAGKRHC